MDTVIIAKRPQAKVETRALKAKRPGLTDERYNETTYYVENGNTQPSPSILLLFSSKHLAQ